MTTEMINADYWNLFEPTVIDNSTIEKEYTEYREINVSGTAALTKYEIETKDKDAFLQIGEGVLECRYQVTSITGAALTAQEDSCIQNHALSMFKQSQILCEDQLIEQCDQPGLAHYIKDLSEFSHGYSKSIASNEHFFLDSADEPASSNRSSQVRFYINTSPRIGNEITFVQGAAFQLVPAQPIAAAIGLSTTWFTGDSIIARIGHFYGPIVNFATKANNAANSTAVIRSATLLGGTGIFTLSGGNATDLMLLYVNNDPYGIKLYTIPTSALTAGLVAAVAAGQDVEVPYVNGLLGNNPLILGGTGTQPTFQTFAAAGNISIAVNWQRAGAVVYAQSYQNISNSYNDGFDKRVKICGSGQLVTAMIPLKCMYGFCKAWGQKVTRGLRWRLILNRESDGQVIFHDTTTIALNGSIDRSFSLSYISCWIPRLKPSLSALSMIEKQLVSSDTFDVHFTDINLFRTATVQSNSANNATFQLSTTSKKVVRCWVAMQRSERVNDSQIVNKRVFDLLGTTSIQCRLNGKIYPLYEYKLTYNTATALGIQYPVSGVNRLYNAFLESGNKLHNFDESSPIDLNSFLQLHSIFYFDMTNQPEELFQSLKASEIEIRWSNQAGGGTNSFQAPNGYYLFVVTENERLIKMKGLAGSLALVL